MAELTEVQRKLLAEIAEGPAAVHPFQVAHEDHLDDISTLATFGLIIAARGQYHLSLKGLLKSDSPKSSRLLDLMRKVYEAVRQWYKDHRDKQWTTILMAQQLGIEHKDACEAWGLLDSGGFALFGSSGGDEQQGINFTMGDAILRIKTFDKFIEMVQGPPSTPPKNQFVTPPVEPAVPEKPKWSGKKSLGEGGQARTFLVRDRSGNTFVMKELKNLERKDRFVREVQSIKGLQHPNIIRVVDEDLATERPYFIMEFCGQGDIGKHAHIFKANPDHALNVFRQVCEAIAYAHAQNPPVIHRDIKPGNILVRSAAWDIAVSDFGLCFIEDEPRLTETSEAVGARHYMCPELEGGRARQVTPACDVYSLGKLLYWLLSGGIDLPRERHREQDYDLCKTRGDAAYEHFNRLLDRALEPKAGSRVANVGELLLRFEESARLFCHRFNVVEGQSPQRCLYCGIGFYRTVARKAIDVRNFGLQPTGNTDWTIMVCENCGNVQMCRRDLRVTKRQVERP